MIKDQNELKQAFQSRNSTSQLMSGGNIFTFHRLQAMFRDIPVLNIPRQVVSFIYDNCSVNTGKENGIGACFDRLVNSHYHLVAGLGRSVFSTIKKGCSGQYFVSSLILSRPHY